MFSSMTTWSETYLPYVKEHYRPSTVSGYEQLWESVLQKAREIGHPADLQGRFG
jgi:hypothetical protein